jgi:hypothetical protein
VSQGFTIHFEWLSGVTVQARAPELQATWARVTFMADGVPVRLGRDKESNASQESLTVPLYPLAEWIAFNWWLIFEDPREPDRRGLDRRSMRQAGDGFLWPDLAFRPNGPSMLLTIAPVAPLAGEYLQFEGDFRLRAETSMIVQRLTEVVTSVLARLDDAGVGATPLHEEWARLQQLDADEVEFCRATAKLALDPFTEGVELAQSIVEAFDAIPIDIRDEFASAAIASSIGADASWVTARVTALEGAQAPTAASMTLADARSGFGPRSHASVRPWRVGYRAAGELRERLEIPPDQRIAGLPVSFVNVASTQARNHLQSLGRRMDGSSLAVAAGRPLSENAERFAAARVLALAALDPTAHYVLATSGHTYAQSVSRSFAAELLAPAAGIEALLGYRPHRDDEFGIAAAAAHFGVAEQVIDHQIENQLNSSGRS